MAVIAVSDEAFAYLSVQRGGLHGLRGDRARWQAAYESGLRDSYESMREWLPRECGSILDVGAGLGGIDVLLSRHYGGAPRVTLLDGEDDDPRCKKHARTFSSRAAALKFQEDNGVRAEYISPGRLVRRQYDLVVSTGAWCFHFPPGEYIDFVRSCCNSGTVLILDVRRDQPAWHAHLCSVFGHVADLIVGPKRVRKVYSA